MKMKEYLKKECYPTKDMIEKIRAGLDEIIEKESNKIHFTDSAQRNSEYKLDYLYSLYEEVVKIYKEYDTIEYKYMESLRWKLRVYQERFHGLLRIDLEG